jgi:hypothetical protein
MTLMAARPQRCASVEGWASRVDRSWLRPQALRLSSARKPTRKPLPAEPTPADRCQQITSPLTTSAAGPKAFSP